MFGYLLSPLLHFASAQSQAFPSCSLSPGPDTGGNIISFLKFPTWYKYLHGEIIAGKCTPVVYSSSNPGLLGQSIGLILLAVVEIMLRIAALLAIGFVIYGGFKFILSQGEPDQTNAARTMVINAIIGLVITTMATFIVEFVFRNFAK